MSYLLSNPNLRSIKIFHLTIPFFKQSTVSLLVLLLHYFSFRHNRNQTDTVSVERCNRSKTIYVFFVKTVELVNYFKSFYSAFLV